jgi:tetratricopeptide (TPR) repeat protein
MKKLLLFCLLALNFCAFAQDLSYDQWLKEAETNIRLWPKFNNAEKTEEQKAADQKLIDDYVKQEGSRAKASELLVNLGFDYLYKGNIKTAMYRFNQAWLLNPENENVFWGFGAVYLSFGDVEKALAQYDEGLTINPKSSNLLTDKGTAYMYKYQQEQNMKDMDTAIDWLLRSYGVDKTNQNTLFKLSACYFFKDDCSNAVKYLKQCDELGGRPVTEEYREALKDKCKS